jgi:hypothetical protein
MRMTLDSICKVGFGVEIGTLSPDLPENSFAQAFDATNIIVTLRFIDPLWRLKRFLHVGSEALLEQSIKAGGRVHLQRDPPQEGRDRRGPGERQGREGTRGRFALCRFMRWCSF